MKTVPYFIVEYRLYDKSLDGKLSQFEKTRDLYVANVVADEANKASERLLKMFSMLHVEIISVSDKKEMTLEEYLQN